MRPITPYEQRALQELEAWKKDMQLRPGVFAYLSTKVQRRINKIIPEKVHSVITAVFKIVTKFLLTGSDL